MSSIAVAMAAVAHAGGGLKSRWTRCGRNFKRIIGVISTLSAIVGLCSALYAQGLLPASQSYVRDEIGKQVAPMSAKVDVLHKDISSLQSDLIKFAQSPPSFDVVSQLSRIETMLLDMKKIPDRALGGGGIIQKDGRSH